MRGDGSRTDDRSKDLLRLVLGHAPVRLLADEIRELATAGKPAAATKQACVASRDGGAVGRVGTHSIMMYM